MNSNQFELIYLLKEYDITNICFSKADDSNAFIKAAKSDSAFSTFEGIDFRSVSYLAIGIANESRKPVVIFCSNIFSIKNAMSAMTEAFYSKLPILLISESNSRIEGTIPPDVFGFSYYLKTPETKEEQKYNNYLINIGLERLIDTNPISGFISYSPDPSRHQHLDFYVEKIAFSLDSFDISKMNGKNFAIAIGNHQAFSLEQIKSVENFCKATNAIVLEQITSNYFGDSAIPYKIGIDQGEVIDYLVLIGDFYNQNELPKANHVIELLENNSDPIYYPNACLIIKNDLIGFFTKISNIQFNIQIKESNFESLSNTLKRFHISKHDIVFVGCNSLLEQFNKYKNDIVVYSNNACKAPVGILSMALGYAINCFSNVRLFLDETELVNELNVLGHRDFPKNLQIICVSNKTFFESIKQTICNCGFKIKAYGTWGELNNCFYFATEKIHN